MTLSVLMHSPFLVKSRPASRKKTLIVLPAKVIFL